MKIALFSVLFFALGLQSAFAQDANFEVQQQVRNLTEQNFTWTESVQANPGDRIEFRVRVTWQGAQPTQNVFVRETLGDGLTYAANTLKLDGNAVGGNIVTDNVNIGTIGSAQTKTVTFEGQVASSTEFAAGTSRIVNIATVFNTDGGATSVSMVDVGKAGAPTDVPTGPLSIGQIALTLLFLAVAGATGFLFVRSYIRREVLESPYDSRSVRHLAANIDRIRKREKKTE